MLTIAVAQGKGGVAKTTLSIRLSQEFARNGVKTVLLDADNNRHSFLFQDEYIKQEENPLIPWQVRPMVIRNDGRDNLLDLIRTAEMDGTIKVAIIDMPAGIDDRMRNVVQTASLVLVPTQQSIMDANDAVRTAEEIQSAEWLLKRKIPSALIWTKVPSRFASRAERRVVDLARRTFQATSIYKNYLKENQQFHTAYMEGHALWDRPEYEAADKNIRAIYRETMDLLTRIQTGKNFPSMTEALRSPESVEAQEELSRQAVLMQAESSRNFVAVEQSSRQKHRQAFEKA